MVQPTISIIGAGIGALALGRCLLKRGIKTVLYEAAPSSPRHSYAITLHHGSYTPLLPVLGLDESTLKSRIAVDAGIGGTGKVGVPRGLESSGSAAFRAHRGKFEELLREGLEVKWEHTLEHVGQESDGRLALHFDNGQRISSDIVIAVEGPHSPIRKQYLPEHKPTVLPYVAFNGKRKLERKEFDDIFRPALSDRNVIESKQNDVNLTISTNDVNENTASVSWVYSRPARCDSDPLHKPGRSTAAAKETPEAFFQEISALQNLAQPFRDIFDAERLRKERILHWLMRSVLVPTEALQELGRKNIWMMGDAVHAEQIIGGNGANAAIVDALSLAEHVGENGVSNIEEWYAGRRELWEADVEKSLRNIAMMHGGQQSIREPQQHL
jgi:2-polyprenyl-6-methoxyphenol hydroxylase-like FAD-dependent oxidoreductase